MRIAGRIGLAVALLAGAGWAGAQEPGERERARADAERERRERESEMERSEQMRQRTERAREQADREREKAEQLDDRYDQGTDLVDEGRWEDAIRAFDDVARQKGRRADAALYWKAYAQQKLGRNADALETLNRLRSEHAKSSWVKESRALEQEIRQGRSGTSSAEGLASEDEDLKLMAVHGLMNSNPEQALPILKKLLEGSQSPKLKDRALFVLAQSGAPEARQILSSVARGQSNPGLQRKAIQYLALHGGDESRAELAEIYKDASDPAVKKSVLQAFMIGGDKQRLLAAARGEKDESLRRAAIQQLGVIGAQDELWQMYGAESSVEAKKSIQQALFVGGSSGRLIELVRVEKDPGLRLNAVRNLGLIGSADAHAALESLYKNESDASVREAVLQAFFISGNAKRLIEVARTEKDPTLKRRAIQHLSVMGSPEATQFLLEILEK